MIFKELYTLWKKKGLLGQVMDELDKMFEEDRNMYGSAVAALFEGKKIDMDMYKEDKRINKYEKNIRKKILEHLSINSCQDVTYSLVLIGMARDIERIGDFCKNLLELSYLYNKPLDSGPYALRLVKAEQKIQEMFDLAKKAYVDNDLGSAKKVVEMHNKEITKELSKMVEDIMRDKEIAVKKAVVCTLCSRYLKRISAHLYGIASAIVNPFDKVRHSNGKKTTSKKNVPAWKLKK